MALTINQLATSIQAITQIGKALKAHKEINPNAISYLVSTGWDDEAINWLTSDINNTRKTYIRALNELRARVAPAAPHQHNKELDTL